EIREGEEIANQELGAETSLADWDVNVDALDDLGDMKDTMLGLLQETEHEHEDPDDELASDVAISPVYANLHRIRASFITERHSESMTTQASHPRHQPLTMNMPMRKAGRSIMYSLTVACREPSPRLVSNFETPMQYHSEHYPLHQEHRQAPRAGISAVGPHDVSPRRLPRAQSFHDTRHPMRHPIYSDPASHGMNATANGYAAGPFRGGENFAAGHGQYMGEGHQMNRTQSLHSMHSNMYVGSQPRHHLQVQTSRVSDDGASVATECLSPNAPISARGPGTSAAWTGSPYGPRFYSPEIQAPPPRQMSPWPGPRSRVGGVAGGPGQMKWTPHSRVLNRTTSSGSVSTTSRRSAVKSRRGRLKQRPHSDCINPSSSFKPVIFPKGCEVAIKPRDFHGLMLAMGARLVTDMVDSVQGDVKSEPGVIVKQEAMQEGSPKGNSSLSGAGSVTERAGQDDDGDDGEGDKAARAPSPFKHRVELLGREALPPTLIDTPMSLVREGQTYKMSNSIPIKHRRGFDIFNEMAIPHCGMAQWCDQGNAHSVLDVVKELRYSPENGKQVNPRTIQVAHALANRVSKLQDTEIPVLKAYYYSLCSRGEPKRPRAESDTTDRRMPSPKGRTSQSPSPRKSGAAAKSGGGDGVGGSTGAPTLSGAQKGEASAQESGGVVKRKRRRATPSDFVSLGLHKHIYVLCEQTVQGRHTVLEGSHVWLVRYFVKGELHPALKPFVQLDTAQHEVEEKVNLDREPLSAPATLSTQVYTSGHSAPEGMPSVRAEVGPASPLEPGGTLRQQGHFQAPMLQQQYHPATEFARPRPSPRAVTFLPTTRVEYQHEHPDLDPSQYPYDLPFEEQQLDDHSLQQRRAARFQRRPFSS
ncbi:Hypothetical Protein FCC1311_051602, partial [Hondaea fermentalgiana]